MAKPATLRDLIASWRSAARLLEGNATAARRAGDVEAAIISTERAKGIDACAAVGYEAYVAAARERRRPPLPGRHRPRARVPAATAECIAAPSRPAGDHRRSHPHRPAARVRPG